jgi:hypothetical protein
MKRYYKITDLIVEMDTFGRTESQALPYLADGYPEADISIVSGWEKFQKKFPFISDSESEYYCSAYRFYTQLVDFSGLMLHSSAVIMDGRAYLFSAPSGTGKSTHTQLWLDVFGDRATILNDDKPAIRRIDGVWYAYGTPWSGKYDMSINTRVPLGGICVLRRGEVNKIEPYRGYGAIKDVFKQTPRNANADYVTKLLELLDSLLCEVPVWRMECNTDPEAARMAYAAMSGRKEK